MSIFENKLVAVMNNKVENGKAMNALAHMCIGFGTVLEKNKLRLTNFRDAGGGSHPNISEIPFIILSGNTNKIRDLRAEALRKGVQFIDFTDTMTGGDYEEQLERSAATREEDLTYLGLVLFGEWNLVSSMTRRYSLWK